MKVRLVRLTISALAVIFFALAAAVPAQADEGWLVTAFISDIAIAADSTLTIKEDIAADFGSLQKHGIFRTIPLRYRYDSNHDRYYELNVSSVTDGARQLPYTTSIDNDNQVIKIGDPNRTVSGVNRYVITYTVRGALNSFAKDDELFWNVDGALWPVPKSKVIATVTAPAGAIVATKCYQGPTGSHEMCSFVAGAGQPGSSFTFSATRQLGSGEQMSIVAALKKGAIPIPPPLLESRKRQFPQDAFEVNSLTVGLSALIVLVGVGLVAWNWWVHGRDRAYLTQYYLTNDPRQGAEPLFRHDPVVVEFEPPQKLRPAQLGMILDESADSKDVTATIVDLAVRGNMTISEIPGAKDWMFTWKGGDASTLLPYEKTLLEGLFAGRKDVKLSELRGTFAPTLKTAEGQILEDSMSRKLFTIRPDFAREIWGCLGIAVVLLGGGAAFLLGIAFGWGLVGAAVVIVGLVLLTTLRAMSQRSAAGRDLLQHTLGFRLYMTTAEKYRQQFAAKAQIFTDLLPYAIVFGCVSLWAKAFEGIDTSSTSNWYVGTTPFQAAFLAGNLESMNASISSAIAYTPPSSGSSSGFGSGGFSGGGGGGGGGGSW